ncbi:MAG TPA: zf-HC2 domain-containing protein, partial [Chthonomonadaceae bacterium]|nr:zf-HC2 domain-containing protein [Chthonomonadaceae bacterium]
PAGHAGRVRLRGDTYDMSKNGPGANAKNGSRPPAPSCSDARRNTELKAYVDGELAALPRWRLQRHLTRCAA